MPKPRKPFLFPPHIFVARAKARTTQAQPGRERENQTGLLLLRTARLYRIPFSVQPLYCLDEQAETTIFAKQVLKNQYLWVGSSWEKAL
ncbi:hypothetical protein FH972_018330 [Carpinus fangiana]|uniref:Uncharacterized protein n=1 Tax=Carpinus fangiana TaxID=176857 RepID=A0A5N6RLZ3_9ROSI|nr:hypothetical protein FH972_018330 [Carpinus fangiana]